MFLTVLLSIGGTWITNMVNTSVNESQIQTLLKSDIENKYVNGKFYTLQEKVGGLEKSKELLYNEINHLGMRVNDAEIAAASVSTSIENLAEQIKDLAESGQENARVNAENNRQLIIAITELKNK